MAGVHVMSLSGNERFLNSAPQAERVSAIGKIIAEEWDRVLGCGPLAPEATFFSAGGSSLQMFSAHQALQKRLGIEFDITLMFETPKLCSLAERLAQMGADSKSQPISQTQESKKSQAPDIAIIGLAGRFPGANSLEEFWQHIRQGDTLIRRFEPDELEDAFSDVERAKPNYVPVRPHLTNVDQFDAGFFGIYAREAAAIDPQSRVMLELAHEALESAGHDPRRFDGQIGTFAGSSFPTYLLNNLLGDRARLEQMMSGFQLNDFAELFGNTQDSLPTRIAFKLGLTGPAFSIGTFCSTSLTAIAQACLSLRAGHCDMALAGGVSITFPQKRGYFHLEGGMASPDGMCRPFDKDASGTVFGHGAGIVVLRRLDEALAGGDPILAVIRGVGLNNDGSDKIAYTAPSVQGQAAAIRMAWEDAGLPPASASYVECHGTATPLGDPIELRGLTMAFGSDGAPQSCALGSVKANIGHLDAAAGVVSVIKTALMLSRQEIPPVANFRELNPRIDLEKTPFRIPVTAEPWRSDQPRRAGVSSFGVGGTNVHLVLEEAPRAAVSPDITSVQILPLSACTPEALAELQSRMADHLERSEDSLADIAFTLQEGRGVHPYRSALAASSKPEAALQLRRRPPAPKQALQAPMGTAFLFPGQGSQYPGMGSGLYRSEAIYRAVIDEGAEHLRPILGLDLRDMLSRDTLPPEAAARALRETRLTQPALYLTQIATARLWQARGVSPSAMIGHSVGELAAATLAGVMSLHDGLTIIARRGQLMQDQPAGSMLSVRASLAELTPFLDEDCEIAAENAPKLQVVSGPEPAISALAARLAKAEIPASVLHTSHAFHSRMMEPVTEALARDIAKLNLSPPQLPWVSCVSGTWVTPQEATDPAYWAAQARQPVRFAKALSTLAENGSYAYLEIGAGGVLSAFASQVLPKEGAHIIQSLPDHHRALPDEQSMALAFGRLWAAGIPLDFARSGPRGSRRVRLSTYPFQRKSHWVAAPVPINRSGTRAAPLPAPQISTAPQSLRRFEASTSESSLEGPSPDTPASTAALLSRDAVMSHARLPRLISELMASLTDLSGEELTPEQAGASFLELGFDSLFLGQFSQRLTRDYGVTLTFRQLLSDYPTPQLLAEYLDGTLAADPAPQTPAAAPPEPQPLAEPAPQAAQNVSAPAFAVNGVTSHVPALHPAPQPPAPVLNGDQSALAQVMQSQLHLLQSVISQQLASLGGSVAPVQLQAPQAQAVQATVPPAQPSPQPTPTISAASANTAASATAPAKPAPQQAASEDAAEAAKPGRKPFSIGRATNAGGGDLTPAQQAWVNDLTRRYAEQFGKSKAYTQRYRPALADPRSVAGYRQEWKEMVFPLVSHWAKGAYLEDLDGNRLIDFVNGFGTTAFGHSLETVNKALIAQIERGYPIGPQADRAGPIAERFARAVGHERATFCNTGSEAVMAAMRLARAVTGRDTVVIFSNDYHGQFDEVLIKGRSTGEASALPIAPGIPRSGLGNMVVLPYGGASALDWLAAHGREVAAVLVEPVQSRHPETRPADFVRAVRKLTQDSGTALVMDEVVTGFRTGPRGLQGLWGIEADMATYGKVVGGGMPVGMLAGKARFMDALDGGAWSFDDDSGPETSPTFFAGTFVRHPLVLAAVEATLDLIETEGPKLWSETSQQTQDLVERLNGILAVRGLPRLVEGYASWFVLNLSNHDPNATLIFPLLRLAGINVQVGYACFTTTAHGPAEFDRFAAAFEAAVDELRAQGILASAVPAQGEAAKSAAPSATAIGAKDLAQQVSAPVATAAPRDLARTYPPTEAQTEIWMTSQLFDAASAAFNEGASLTLKGTLDRDALSRALNQLIARHDALRQRFAPDGSSFTLLEPYELDLPLIDLSGTPDVDAAVAKLLAEDAAKPFDLVNGPPLRAQLLRRAENLHELAMTAHHIVCDGWSYNTVFTDLARLYEAEVSGAQNSLPPAPSFAEHAQLAAMPRPETLDYWREIYRSLPELPDLPTDAPRGALRSWEGATFTRHIPAEVMQAARKAGAKQGCTLFATLFAALQLVLSRLSGSDDIVLTVPTGGQALLADQGLVGHLVNLLPVRAKIDLDAPLSAHLTRVRDAVMAAFDHSDITYGSLVRELGIARNLNRLPLTEVQFNLEKIADRLPMPGLEAEAHPNPKAAVNFDLFVNIVERRDGLRVDVDYKTALYHQATIARWMDHLEQVLIELARDSAQPAGLVPLLPQAALKDLEAGLPPTQIPNPALLPQMFAKMVQTHPQKIAVEDGSRQLTYAELERLSEAITQKLLAKLPNGGARIAIGLPRGADYLAAMLGVLRAGHAYVPLDILQPEARLAQIVSTAEVALVLHEGALPTWAGSVAGMGLPKPGQSSSKPRSAPKLTAETSAYVIFTSGSTGVPKGVEISHGALANLLGSMLVEPGLSASDTLLAVTTTSFDIAALELFAPLLVGAKVVIASQSEVLGGFALVARIAKGDITHLQATPTLWSMLLEAGLASGPNVTMLCGGEPLPADLAQKLLATGGRLWNLYGPTETTIWSAVEEVLPSQPITIGHPVAQTSLHILGPRDELLPIGAVGELNIGGAGLAKGYFGRADLTAEAFREVALPSGRQKLYRTGDLARRRADGRIEVLGRRDGQIKLRGFRIELGEIETALRQLPGIAAAAVALKPSPRGDQLVAYLVASGADLPDPIPALAAQLPAYMVPSVIMRLPELPQTDNGKLDRKALPTPDFSAPPPKAADLAKTATEARLAEIWQQVLGRAPISVTESLYTLGADSLTAFRIAARMLEAGLGLSAKDLLAHPSIRELATYADGSDRPQAPSGPSLRAYRGGAKRTSHADAI